MAVATVAVATVGLMVVATAVATVAIMVVATVAIMVVATVAVVTVGSLKLILLTPTNHLVQTVGRIEVMETLLKILNMKAEEAGEKEVFLMMVMPQIKKISNPFLQA